MASLRGPFYSDLERRVHYRAQVHQTRQQPREELLNALNGGNGCYVAVCESSLSAVHCLSWTPPGRRLYLEEKGIVSCLREASKGGLISGQQSSRATCGSFKGAHGSPGFIGSAHIYQIRKISRFKADPLVSVERESSLCDRYDMQNIMRS
ncbi:hypothetical protein EVAR_21015_1 [Eumeta japonica]|uniref:Uncharacterized protein n=1 Tax=Eumeta variegata TaxID=151549 RepID=A0A4C1UZQ0_EUMVA|nr:hypothetical protein EVAR_21015_1 [Eumeta japonica]